MRDKQINGIIFFGVTLFLLLMWKKAAEQKNGNTGTASDNNLRRSGDPLPVECTNPDFGNVIIDVITCRGEYLNEQRLLGIGDFGCEVVVLQQRLNQIQQLNILRPSGKFDCATLKKLQDVKNRNTIALNDFEPEEQTGLDTLRPSNVYSTQKYMEL